MTLPLRTAPCGPSSRSRPYTEDLTRPPNLLATTSFDGSIATTFKRTVTDTVCDNTRAAALGEQGQSYKVKHSRHSKLQITTARQALAMIHTVAEDFAAEIRQLCRVEVSDQQWRQFLALHVPVRDQAGQLPSKRSLTMAAQKVETLQRLYRHDTRVEPWAGTAHGVLQAVNTYEHHENTVRGATRADRNMLRTITGEFSTLDRNTWTTLQLALSQ